MTRINWDETGSRFFSAGVDRGVLYLQNGSGLPWNGLISVNETPSDADVVDNYYDGMKFFAHRIAEGFAGTIEAFSYPLEFEKYDGQVEVYSSQSRKTFNFSYRTRLGDDVDGLEAGYFIHLVYNVLVKPSPRDNQTLTQESDPIAFNWEFVTAPIEVAGLYSSHLVIDSRKAYSWAIEALENELYGTELTEARLPSAQFIWDLFEDASILKITDHGDGTWTAEGPDEAIVMLDDDLFEITWPSAVYIDTEMYRISSL